MLDMRDARVEMGRVVVMLAAVVVGCGTGGGGASRAATGTVDPAAATGAKVKDDAPPYPLIWSRALPAESVFEAFAVHVEPITGDVVVAGAMKRDVRMAGAAIDQVGPYDGLVVRFDAHDGAQLWVTQIVTTRALAIGSNAAGDTLVIGDYLTLPKAATTERAVREFVAKLDRSAGAVLWLADFGSRGPNNGITRSDELLAWLDESAERTPAQTTRMEDLWGLRLPDGALALSSRKPPSLVVRELDRSLRWRRTDLAPISIAVEASGGLLVAGARLPADPGSTAGADGETDLALVAIDPSAGTTIWQLPIDPAPLLRPTLSIAGDDHTVLAWEDDTLGSTRVYTVGSAGALLSIDEIPPGALTDSGPDGALYAVRGATGERELVKLGPCPVARCSIDAR